MSATISSKIDAGLGERFRTVRQRTLALCKPLTAEDMMVQSCAEASPAKWHLAHTAWFFESFILSEFLSGYKLFDPNFPWLFNSYYRSFAEFPEKRLRSSFSRPAVEEVLRYREHVDEGIERLLEQNPEPEALRRIELGANHEEQHQELLLTDILHAFFTNPLRPAYVAMEGPGQRNENQRLPLGFQEFTGGLMDAGFAGSGFCYDNEMPRHRAWLEPYELANRLVTNREFAEFIADGGYRRSELWLSAGWDAVEQNRWRAPLYWTEEGKSWKLFTLRGELPFEQVLDTPVSQVSYFEADAYARWAGKRLPTEFEWETAAEDRVVNGNLLDTGNLRPVTADRDDESLAQLWGDCWEWTGSAYLGYAGFEPLPGSLGEYNGKFMSGQMVLRGGSCATPQRHIRSSYRNFFQPETRWQFSGIRLADK
ncbi:MAG TPA: ergothioneine biosynthesis protein EgtB [Terracidiphilus sp.]|jgi:ergothioneine biosynthesis protein EgtB